MRSTRNSNLVLLAVLLIIAGPAIAQQDSTHSQTLDEVVISASRESERVLDAPRTITVIGREKIENSTYNSVGDLLAKQQGIYVVGANQTPGTNQSLFLRGANSNQITVLIDGARITDPSSPNNAIDLSELSLTNVERIEILEGAHSTLYGGAAIGGVVNIITRKDQKPGVHGFAGIQGGTFGNGSSTFSQQADINATLGKGWYVNGSLFNQNVNGLNASLDTAKNGRTPDKDGFRKTDAYLKAGYHRGGWDGFVSYKNTSQRADIDNGAYQDDDNAYIKFNRSLWNYALSYRINPHWKVSAVGSATNSKRLNENDSSLINASQYDGSYSRNIYNGSLSTNEATVTYESSGFQVLAGGGVYREKMNFNTYFYSSSFGGFSSTTNYDTINSQATTRYAMGQVQWHGGKNKMLGITAGGRVSHHSLFGTYSTFEFSPSVALTNTSLLFGNISSGFNAPSLYQLFNPTMSGSFTTQGNRDLKPETSLSVELGYKKQFASGSFVTASAFQTDTRHAIEYVYLWNSATPVNALTFADYLGDTYLNLSRQTVLGVELAGKIAFTNKFSFNGNVSWMKGTFKASPADIDQTKTGGNHVQLFSNGAFLDQEIKTDQLVRRPRVTSFGEFRYQLSTPFSVTAGYRLAGKRLDSAYDPTLGPFGALASSNVKQYTLLDAGFRWDLRPWIALVGRVENITNEAYQEINGFATRGRSGYLKVNFRF